MAFIYNFSLWHFSWQPFLQVIRKAKSREPERFPPFCLSFSDAVVIQEIRNWDAILEERPEVFSMITWHRETWFDSGLYYGNKYQCISVWLHLSNEVIGSLGQALPQVSQFFEWIFEWRKWHSSEFLELPVFSSYIFHMNLKCRIKAFFEGVKVTGCEGGDAVRVDSINFVLVTFWWCFDGLTW